MKWPLVWRSTMERAVADAVREERRGDGEVVVPARVYQKDLAAAEAATVRSEVRAQEWEAIARELIARGAGRPKPETDAKPESALAKRIREESAGDPALAAHFWKNVVAPARRDGKKDEEIVDLIGWTDANPEPVS